MTAVPMTEPDATKSRGTRRRVVMGAAGSILLLALARLVFVLCASNATPVRVSLEGFESSVDGTKSFALLNLRNQSKGICISFVYEMSESVHGGIDFGPRTNRVMDESVTVGGAGVPVVLTPSSRAIVKLLLPRTGVRGRPGVWCLVTEERKSGITGWLRNQWRRYFPRADLYAWCVSDQELQCPGLRPDGTLEPARMLSNEDR